MTDDGTCLRDLRKEFILRVRKFRPFMNFHNFDHDTCGMDYGDSGLTPSFFPRLTEEIKQYAEEVCDGRYLIITHGGYLSDVAEYIFPRIVEILARP